MEDNQIENLDHIDGSNEAVAPQEVEDLQPESPEGVEGLAEEVEDQQDDEQPKKKPGSARAREALRRKEEEVARLQARIDALEGLVVGKQPKVPQLTNDLQAPVEAAYETYEQYQEALLEYKLEKKLAERERKRAEEDQKRNAATTWENKVKTGIEKYGDKFKDLLDIENINTDINPPTKQTVDLITGPDVPIEVVHWLLTHPSEHNKLNSMSQTKAAIFLGQIEERITKQPIKTKAPEPIKPLTNSARVSPRRNEMMETY